MSDAANLSGIKVMIIDDSNTIRRSAEIFLVQAGCQVVLAEDGFDALAKIADHQPAVIFCDIMMPRLDGYQTCALIKKNQRFRNTPLIMLSSKDGLFDRARGRMVGSDHYLTKPVFRQRHRRQRRQGNDLAGVCQIEQPEVVADLNPEQTCRALVANTGQPSRQVRLKFSKTASLSHKKADG